MMITTANAQITEQLFLPRATELLNLSTEELRFIDQVRHRTFVADVQLVSLANVFDLQNNGYVRFAFLGARPQNILVETLDIQYDAADNYRYKGIVRDTEGLSIGELIINRLPQGYSGDFRFDEEAYELIHLREGLNILVKREVPEGYEFVTCKEQNFTSTDTKNNFSSIDCPTKFTCKASSTLLFLVTPGATTYLNQNNENLELTMTKLIERVNHTQEISLSRMNVTYNYEFLDYPYFSDFVSRDVDSLAEYLPAQQLRANNQADLVVLITNREYPGIGSDLAAVSEIGLDKDHAYAIVPLQHTGFPEYLFVHEVGHLYGAMHDQPFGPNNETFCAQAHFIFNNAKTAVHQSPPRVLHYSNPKVYYNGYPTGIAGSNPSDPNAKNNSGRIRDIGCEVADYFGNMDMTVWINGDDNICNVNKTYIAKVTTPQYGSQGQPPYSYQWFYSLNGVFNSQNTTPITGSSSTLNLSPPVNSCNTFFLHLEVTSSDGINGRYTKKIKRLSSNCSLCSSGSSLIRNNTNSVYSDEIVQNSIEIFPNPSSNVINIKWHALEGNDRTLIKIANLSGEIVYRMYVQTLNGNNEFTTNIYLPNGVYYIKLLNDELNLINQIIIQN